MVKYEFTLKGLTPFLMHADNVVAADTLKEWRENPANKNVSVPGDDRSPAWTWHSYVYSDGNILTIPSECLMTSLRAAGAEVTLKGTKTFKSATQTGLLVEQEHMPMLVGDETIAHADVVAIDDEQFKEHLQRVKPLGFELFVKRASVGAKKHVRVRPRFNEWSTRGTMIVTGPEFTKEKLTTIFKISGLNKGIGDWRPNSPKSPGPYGRFEVELKQVA